MKVLVTDKINETAGRIIEQTAQVDFLPTMTEDELIKIIPQYDAMMVRSQTKVTAKIIEAGTNLKIIGRAGVGVDNIDVEAATQKGIIVVNSPDGNTMAAAEHTVALMLAMSRNIVPAATSTKEGKWDRSKFTGCELYKKTLGIIGLGKIGTHVAEVSLAFGMKIVVFDPYTSKEIVEKYDGKTPETIEELTKFKGVGRKTANLVLTKGFNKPAICVDVHVHRIFNRLKYVKTKAPDETEMVLRKKLPKKYWTQINTYLVTLGQNVCKPIKPKCEICPIKELCAFGD